MPVKRCNRCRLLSLNIIFLGTQYAVTHIHVRYKPTILFNFPEIHLKSVEHPTFVPVHPVRALSDDLSSPTYLIRLYLDAFNANSYKFMDAEIGDYRTSLNLYRDSFIAPVAISWRPCAYNVPFDVNRPLLPSSDKKLTGRAKYANLTSKSAHKLVPY